MPAAPAALTLAALSVFAAAAAAQGTPPAGRCLSRFASDRDHFDRCKREVCFLFLEDEPYIVFDPLRRDERAQELFTCAAHWAAPGGPSGSTFGVLNATRPRALCAWAGAGCTFDGLTGFLSARARDAGGFQFAAAGLLLESPARVTSVLYPSSSIIDSQLVIIGPAEEARAAAPLATLLRPFRRGAWVLLWSMVALFLLLGLAIVAVFAPAPVRWSTLFFHFIGEPVEDDDAEAAKVDAELARAASARSGVSLVRRRTETPSESHSDAEEWEAPQEAAEARSSKATYRAALWLYRVGLSAFIIMFILFYEISVVNFMFVQNTRTLAKNVAHLSKRELSEYATLKASGIEEVWRKTVDPHQIYNESNFPWFRCETASACFDKILEKDNKVKFVITFDNFGRYQMLKRRACRKLTIYSTQRRLYSFGAGWLYGKGVRPEARREIDRAILDLRVTTEMRRLMNMHNGMGAASSCPATRSDIGVSIIGIAVLVLVGPSLVLLSIILFAAWYKGTSSENHEAHNDFAEFVRRSSGRSNARKRHFNGTM